MKKLVLSVATLAMVFLIGCNGGGGDPKQVLMNFFDALGKKDIAAAKKYATKESESMLAMMEMGMKMAPDKKEEKFDKSNMEFGEPKIDGDKATVPVKDKKSGETTDFVLKKEGGAWKVAFDKSSMMQMGADKMKEKGMDMNDLNNKMNNMSTDSTSTMSTDTTH